MTGSSSRGDDVQLSVTASRQLTFLIPALNEEETIGGCIVSCFRFFKRSQFSGEVLVVDNDSTDATASIARAHGARVVTEKSKGYGAAIRFGLRHVTGQVVVMADADGSYDFQHAGRLLERLDEGFDLVLGNRFAGGIEPGAMPFLNRYLGNPVLSGVGRFLFGCPVGDFHCGLRAFRVAEMRRLQLSADGMEFASEMVIRAVLDGLKVSDVPTILKPDCRPGKPHLRPWSDGWRHLVLMIRLYLSSRSRVRRSANAKPQQGVD